MQGLGAFRCKRADGRAHLRNKLFCALGQLADLQPVCSGLKRHFISVGIETYGIYIRQTPLKALNIAGKYRKITFIEPEFSSTGAGRTACLTQLKAAGEALDFLQVFQQQALNDPLAVSLQQIMAQGFISLAKLPQDDAASGIKRQAQFPVRRNYSIEIAQIKCHRRTRLRSQGEFFIIKLHPAWALLGDTAARSKILEFPVEVCHADQAILLPHSGQNLVLPSTLVPQREHSFFGRSALPHSGPNLAPCVWAPQAGQSATASLVRSRSLVRSWFWSLVFIWSIVVCTCAEANSVSRSGAQSKHSERLAFQQASLHTQCVHLGHWRKLGLVSSIAARNALSWAGP